MGPLVSGASRTDTPDPGTRSPAATARRLVVLAAALLTALLAVVLPSVPASAHDGCLEVTVVVDFGTLADEPATGCAVDPANGLDALAGAGFSVTEVASIRGMVCRIDELPESTCGGAPPAKEYWSYWRAGSGDAEWSYSPVGGADARPDAGDVEGWVFGDGSTPPALAPIEAAESTEGRGPDESEETSFTWVIGAAALLVIAGLALWRMRRDRRA
jgi:MYXO-CTERM domain-containing protein